MLFVMNRIFGEQFFNWVIGLLEKMAISFWSIAGATIIMIIGIALCLSLLVNVSIHVGGGITFLTTTVVGIIFAIVAVKWLLLFFVFGVPCLIITFGVHRAMKKRRVDPTIRGLFLWAAILLII